MAEFYKRTREELEELSFVQVTFDLFNREYFLNWTQSQRPWRDMAGGNSDFSIIQSADLECIDTVLKADDWRHLCSIVGLKEAHARTFFRARITPNDFEDQGQDLPPNLFNVCRTNEGGARIVAPPRSGDCLTKEVAGNLAAWLCAQAAISHFEINKKLGVINRGK